MSSSQYRPKIRGIYVPPARIPPTPKENGNRFVGNSPAGDEADQRQAWQSMKKSIESIIGQIDTKCKIDVLFNQLLEANLIRGRGVFSNVIINAQQLTPKYTMQYATMVALVNSQISMVGELVIKRLIIKLHSNKLTNKTKAICINILQFLAHLINQNVAQIALAMQIARHLLDIGSPEAYEVLLTFLKECGSKMDNSDRKDISQVVTYLQSSRVKLGTKLEFMLGVFLDHRKEKFAEHPTILPELDLVAPERQYTHRISLQDKMIAEDELNFFKYDPEFLENETKYHAIRQSVVIKQPESSRVTKSDSVTTCSSVTNYSSVTTYSSVAKQTPKERTEKEMEKPREVAKKFPFERTGKKKTKWWTRRGKQGKECSNKKNKITIKSVIDSVADGGRYRREEVKKVEEKKPKEEVQKPKQKEEKEEEKKFSNKNIYYYQSELYPVYDPEEEKEEEFDSGSEDVQDSHVSQTSTYSYQSSSNVAKLRKEIRQAIQTTTDSEIALQKLLQFKIANSYFELCSAVAECCAQPSCYLKHFGSLAQKLCQKDSRFGEQFVELFKDTYDTLIDMREPGKIANIAKLFADLLKADAIPWTVLGHIRLKEDLIKSWHRNFIKILFQKLAELIELSELRKRLRDPQLEDALRGLFPRDNPQHARYAISFLTSIGLIDLTFDFRKKLKKLK